MAKKLRGGKRRAAKLRRPRSGGQAYRDDVIEVYMKVNGKKYGSSYSVEKHGVRKADRMADEWLERMRAWADEVTV